MGPSFHDSIAVTVSSDSTESDSTTAHFLPEFFYARKLPGQAEALAEGKALVDRMKKNYRSHPFRKPVDCEIYKDYQELIKHPMDLQTVSDKFTNNQYLTVQELANDVKLIFSNCKIYNDEGSPMWCLADAFEQSFMKKYGIIHENCTCDSSILACLLPFYQLILIVRIGNIIFSNQSRAICRNRATHQRAASARIHRRTEVIPLPPDYSC